MNLADQLEGDLRQFFCGQDCMTWINEKKERGWLGSDKK
jgi:hypothetical protein